MNKAQLIVFIIILPILFLSKKTHAQYPQNYRFQYLLIENGLPQNTITCIEKDAFDFMWFGTNNGVCRYDSYNFELFKAEEGNIHSLPDNLIHDIKACDNNLIWIGSSKGLCFFDPTNRQITQFTDTNQWGEKITQVNAIITIKNEIWVATNNSGIYKLVPTNNKYKINKHYCTKNKNIENNTVNVIYSKDNKQIYAGSEIGYSILNDSLDLFKSPITDLLLPPFSKVNDIFIDHNENLYIATNRGFYLQYKNATKLTKYDFLANGKNSLIHGTVNRIRQDVSGNILVATLGGLQLFKPELGLFYSFAKDGPDHYKINNEFINTIFCDKSGNVWIGTEKGGINKYNVFQNPFAYFTHNPKDANSLNVNTINSILSEDNLLWIGTAGGGLNMYNSQTNKFQHHTYSNGNHNTLSSDYVTSIARGSNNTLYVGTWGGGVNAIKTNGIKLSIDRITLSDPLYINDLVNGFVSSMVDNPQGYLLIGTLDGLAKLDYKNNKFTTLITPVGMPQQLKNIGCILLDSKGFYWVGTQNGLFRFPQNALRETRDDDFIISQLEFYKHEKNNPNSLPGDYVISIFEDSKSNIWIGTYGNGLAKSVHNFKGEMVFDNLTVANGLSNDVVYGIQEDNHNKIWVSTDYGLSVINTIDNSIRNFYKQDGLLSNQFYWSASHKSANGKLYFGGVEGLNYFDPENFYEYNYYPSPKITKFRIFNEEVFPNSKSHKKDILKKPIYDVDTIKLSYKENNLSFDFSSFDYYLPEKSQYAYMLTGVDKNWITVTAQRRFASYNNLDGGTYLFKLKASNCDGVWNEKATVITIIITPPFWKTTYFKFSLTLVLLFLSYLFVRFQMRRIIAQKKILEEKVKHRTQKIEDQNITLEKQAKELKVNYQQLEIRQKQIVEQKGELETKNKEISEQRDELMLLNDKVNEINQLQLRFFTNISHEFQTPLTLILSPIERLINKLSADKETTQVLNIINRNANRLLLLIRQLLEIRKIETDNQSLQVELTDINAFLLDIFGAFEALAQKNKINYTHQLSLSQSAWIDKDKLENVVYNLLSNAFKFTPHEKSITLRAEMNKVGEKLWLTIAVTDTGEGIAADKMDKLFDRFLQVTESKKHKRAGTGIGLSLVKSLVKIMYGEINVESKINEGSIFTVNIPINKQSFANYEIDTSGQIFESSLKDKVALLIDTIDEPRELNINDNENPVEKILLIEDNADIRTFISSNLSQYYSVIEAENGLIGYELAKKEVPAIIISDVMMPEMNGLELCKKVKNNLYLSHIPIILLTAKSRIEDQIEGLKYGADDYISKPFSIEILLLKIKTIVENRNILRAKFGKLEDVKPEELKVSDLDSKFYTKANEIVQKYYTDPAFDVDQFASEMFVSRSQLYSKLKAITNLSSNDFINTYRLKKSLELLKIGDMQISEIAYATGFNDPKYFSRIFKKYYKSSPSDYIKKRG